MKKVAMSLLALIVVGWLSVGSEAANAAMTPLFSAKIFDLQDRSKHMFDYKNEFEVVGDKKTMLTTFLDLEGKVLVVEKTVVTVGENGSESLLSFEQDHRQLGTIGKIEVADGKAGFSFTKDGKTKTASETIEPNYIVTSMVLGFVQSNWEKLMKGETAKVRLGVVDRRESVGFSFSKESATADKVVIKMKPTSMIISALVSPLRFTFQPDGKKLVELEGRAAVKVQKDGKFKDFDGFTVYTYAGSSPASGPANKK
ncbi:MAG: hypothetical protein U1E10_07415 [Bdellovibrionales bacterium]|nr:hypothetical protein [Bdellovibrionales bacterium]